MAATSRAKGVNTLTGSSVPITSINENDRSVFTDINITAPRDPDGLGSTAISMQLLDIDQSATRHPAPTAPVLGTYASALVLSRAQNAPAASVD
jgi:hypothetical protein